MERFNHHFITLFFLIHIALFSSLVQAQEQPVPEQGEWIKSMGFPQKWKPHIGALFDWNTSGAAHSAGNSTSAYTVMF